MKRAMFITIIIVQLILSICILSQKEGFFGDELLTFSISNSKTSLLGNVSVDPYLNKELEKQIFIDFFQPKNEKFNFSIALENTHYDVHPPLYYYIVHFFSSIFSFSMGGINIYSGIIPNILFFILTQIFIFLISKELINDNVLCFFPVIMYGFSVVGVDSVVTIRMYGMLTTLSCIFIYSHLILINNIIHERSINKANLFFTSATLVAGILTQLYFVILAFFSCAYCFFIFILKKKYVDVIKYSVAMSSSLLLSILLCQDIPSKIFGSNSHADYIANEAVTTSFMKKIFVWYSFIDKNMYISVSFYLLMCFVVFKLIKKFLKNKNDIFNTNRIYIKINFENNLIYILFVYVATLFTIIEVTRFPSSRYIMFFNPLYIVFIIAFLDKILNCDRTKKIITASVVVCIMLVHNAIKYDVMWMNHEQKVVNNILDSDKRPEKIIIITKKNYWWPMLNVFQISTKIDKTYISTEDKIDLLSKIPNKERAVLVYIEDSINENILQKILAMLKMCNKTFLYKACEGKMFLLHR